MFRLFLSWFKLIFLCNYNSKLCETGAFLSTEEDQVYKFLVAKLLLTSYESSLNTLFILVIAVIERFWI
jgi:hypothetical protein